MSIDLDIISASDIQTKAEQNAWLSPPTASWSSLGKVELYLRSILSRIPFLGVDTPAQACLRYSWEALQLAPQTPQNIALNIDTLFEDSIKPNNPLNRVAHSVTALYQRTFDTHIEIQEHPTLRQFEISSETQFETYSEVGIQTVFNTAYGVLVFPNGLINRGDVLYNSEDARVGSLSATPTRISILSGDNLVATLQAEGNERTFILRDTAQKIIGLAVWTPGVEKSFFFAAKPQQWQFTPLSNEHARLSDLFVLALLKHSQQHMESPKNRPYIK